LPGRPGIFVGTHRDRVLFSEDGARSEERNSGLAIKDVYTVVSVAEAGGITLYAGTQPAALFKSRDLGQSWSELATGPEFEAQQLRVPPGTGDRQLIVRQHVGALLRLGPARGDHHRDLGDAELPGGEHASMVPFAPEYRYRAGL
jgi:hypothetical protein